MNVLERFEDLFMPEPNSGCSIWLGSTDVSGYGRFFLNGRNWKANRVAWLLAHSDPQEMHVLHRCDNRLCVNVDHLFLGTNRDNCIDKVKKGRHPLARLSPEQVRSIRDWRATGIGARRIANKMGVDEHLVDNLIYRGTYAHVS